MGGYGGTGQSLIDMIQDVLTEAWGCSRESLLFSKVEDIVVGIRQGLPYRIKVAFRVCKPQHIHPSERSRSAGGS